MNSVSKKQAFAKITTVASKPLHQVTDVVTDARLISCVRKLYKVVPLFSDRLTAESRHWKCAI